VRAAAFIGGGRGVLDDIGRGRDVIGVWACVVERGLLQVLDRPAGPSFGIGARCILRCRFRRGVVRVICTTSKHKQRQG